MKKTFHPLERTEKASQIYKKKTLGFTDNLNIKHDGDDIEDIEEYWNTAVSVIGNNTIDDSIVTEQSDTLFNINNIRKSIKQGAAKAENLYKANINSIMNTEIGSSDYPGEASLNSTKVSEDMSFSALLARQAPEDFEREEIIETKRIPKKFDYSSIPKIDLLEAEKRMGYNSDVRQEGFDIDDVSENISNTLKIVENTSMDQESTIEDFFRRVKTSRISSDTGNNTLDDEDHGSCFMPGVCSKSMETSILRLSPDYLTKNIVSKNSISMIVLKGHVAIRVGSNIKELRRKDVFVVEVGEVYSVENLCARESEIFFTFSL